VVTGDEQAVYIQTPHQGGLSCQSNCTTILRYRSVYKLVKFLKRLLEIIIDNDLIVNAWRIGVLKLDFSLS
jgi:hypothetical protein